jgi:hypothetical protein
MRGTNFEAAARTWTETPRETAAILMKRNATGNRENFSESVHSIGAPARLAVQSELLIVPEHL